MQNLTREYVPGATDPSSASATRTGPPGPGPSADGHVPGTLSAPPPIPGYEIERELGRGGMGVVYLARQTAVNRAVALKMVLAGGRASAAELVRFLGEAAASARLEHPNVVRVLEVGHHDGLPYFTMEYVGGGSLGRFEAPLPPRASHLTAQVARGVAYAHARGIVHRDLKPDNVLLAPAEPGAEPSPDGPPVVPKVADFGLAKWAGTDGLTVTGAVLGTPGYMAPEQAAGSRAVGPPADVYSLGAILYRLLTGRPPFLAATAVETLRLVLDAEPASPSRLVPGIPRDLVTVCLQCLHKDPGRRYPSAAELAADLGRFLAGEPVAARPVGPAERTWKWAKRNRAVAASLAAVVLSLVVGTAASITFAVQARRDADRAAESETLAEGRADAARTAQAAADRARYVSDVRLAGELLRQPDGSARAVADLLAAQVPAAPGDPDLREFTWRMHWTTLNRAAARVPTGGPVARAVVTAEGAVSVLHAGGRWRLYEAATGRVLRELPAPDPPAVAALSADGRLLARGAGGGVTVTDTVGERPFPTSAGGGTVRAVAFAPGDAFLASVWSDDRVRLHDLGTGAERGAVRIKTGGFTALAASPDGARVALANHPGIGQVTVYRPADGTSVTSRSLALRVEAAAFSPDGARLAVSDQDGGVTVLDPATGSVTTPRARVLTVKVAQVAFSADGRRMAAGDAAGAVAWWEAGKPDDRTVLRGHTARVTTVGFSPDGRAVASGDGDGWVRVWDLDRPPPVHRLVPAKNVTAVAFDGKGRQLVAVDLRRTVRVHDPSTGEVVRGVGAGTEDTGGFNGTPRLAATPDLALLAEGDASSVVTVWDAAAGRFVWRSPAVPQDRYGPATVGPFGDDRKWKRAVGALAFSPDGRFLAAGYGARNVTRDTPYDQVVRVWETRSWAEVADLRVRNSVTGLAFTPGGDLIAGCSDGMVHTWRVDGWGKPAELSFGNPVLSLAVSADGGRLVVGLASGALLVRDLRSGAELRRPAAHTGPVRCVAFSPDGRTLASAGRADGAVKFGDADGVRELHRHAYAGAVADLAFSPAGTLLVAAGADGVWAFPAAPVEEIDREPAAVPPGRGRGNRLPGRSR